MENFVKFDPGFNELVVDFQDFINDFYSKLMSLKTINQKRAFFKLYYNKIYKHLENNIAFYLGCILWAYEIYNKNLSSPKEITGNPFININNEQILDMDFMGGVNFIENYFDSFERDTLYYTGNKVQISQEWKDILSIYSEFLQLNNGFTNTKTTGDIILPERIKSATIDCDIENLIQNSINKKDLTLLFEVKISLLLA